MRPNSSTSMSTKPTKAKVPVWKKIVLVLGIILCSMVVFSASFAGAWMLIGRQDFSSDTAELKDKIETLETENKALKDQIKDMDGGSKPSNSKTDNKATDKPAATKAPAATASAKATQKPSGSGGGSNSSATSKPKATEKPSATKAPATAEPKPTQKPSNAGGSDFDIPTINID